MSSTDSSTSSDTHSHATGPLRQNWWRLDSVVATVSVSLLTFFLFAVQGILLARMLGVEDRGKLTSIMLYSQSLLYLGLLGAPELFAGYAARSSDHLAIRRSALRYGVFAAFVTGCLCFVLEHIALPAGKQNASWLVGLACVAFSLQQIRLTMQAVDHGARELVRYNLGRLFAAAAYPLGLCVCFLLGIHSVIGAVWTLFLASMVSLIACQPEMRELLSGARYVSLFQGLKDARKLVGAWLVSEVAEKLDICLMVWLFSDRTVGFYSAAVPIAGMMVIVPNAIGLYAFNRGARRHEHPLLKEFVKLVIGIIAFQVLAGLILAGLVPIAIPLLYREEFRDAIPYAWCLIPAAGIRGILQAADGYLRGRKIFGPTVMARIAGILVLLIGSFTFRPWLGSFAIPLMYDLSQFLVMVVVLLVIFFDIRRQNRAKPLVAEVGA